MLRPEHWPKLYSDISGALRVLHAHNIVHADVHVENIMLRGWPAGFVLIDLASCTGESIYPLELGYAYIIPYITPFKEFRVSVRKPPF